MTQSAFRGYFHLTLTVTTHDGTSNSTMILWSTWLFKHKLLVSRKQPNQETPCRAGLSLHCYLHTVISVTWRKSSRDEV